MQRGTNCATSAVSATLSKYFDFSEFVCRPPMEQNREHLHWLAFVRNKDQSGFPFRVECELWRWAHDSWHCLTLPGASFSAEEMYEQGWRYCKPCPTLVALVRS